MNKKDKLIFWLLGTFAIFLFIYSVSSILLPFVVAIIFAYFLNPSANKLQKFGFSRVLATGLITISFFLVVGAVVVFLAPIFYEQFITFLHTVPTYITYLNEKIVPELTNTLKKIDPHALEKARASAGDISSYSLRIMATMAGNLWNSGMAMLNILSLLFISPVVTFYMLRDWHLIIMKIDSLLPPKYAPTIRGQAKEIDHILSGYLRGQTHVCLIIGIYYAIALTLTGLEFSLLIGFASGFLLFIPYVGALFSFIVGVLVAFFQFGDLQQITMVIVVFLVGQVLESVFITPNLVGGKVHLHPVWIMFGLLAGGAMFGLLGVLIAIPVTAVIGVLARFFIGEYLVRIKSQVS